MEYLKEQPIRSIDNIPDLRAMGKRKDERPRYIDNEKRKKNRLSVVMSNLPPQKSNPN
jgi:hypothetical protein